MLSYIIKFSLKHKLIVFLFTAILVGFGFFSLTQISVGAVPDITNNQVQVITTSRHLSTQDVEQFITYPVELEMANLPGVKEIRSVSKFGLSVVTIVFEDEMGTYLPRQLIAEKIKLASEKIPENFGSPMMGPITTGLGEIYQYVLDVKPGYGDTYSITDLRTIQDWIVRRQLSGIPGVVEVNTWGGYLKQYEVAINSQKLNAMNITTSEILDALERNNSVAGGGYIEKTTEAYFIRAEGLVSSLNDIENIVVKNDGVPVYIKDVAKVKFGSATRFGAITGNGEGEKVLGQIMMLKDASSKDVIKAVKERLQTIEASLPEGVVINGFLDRSELINDTTFTVTENLVLGSLIVIFVVVVLLGSLRSGLVVASVIPLSLLFAISLMNIFGVDANLMSLGAIDFGIIIDGAVIIVEYVAFTIVSNSEKLKALSHKEKQKEMDEITFKSASKMMNSAIFGQLIILIVFIPILSLSGVEGKMFRPMALTFSFALIGAMLLCLTYVPVMASLFLKARQVSSNNISVRLMDFIKKGYDPVITWALRHRKLVIGLAIALLVFSGIVFSKMGGEFVPTLDEGDFVIQPVLETGTSLTKTIEITTAIEQILLDKFPEVDQVVSRIGAAEIPTDPMSMEESDVIIKLKPRSQWVSARTKDDLAEQFKDALAVIPDMEVEFTQPIEMRFNELITGVRTDLAIKIFGEDLSILASKADEVKSLIQDIDGASDITIEKVEGLPQMLVNFNRDKIARYGLNIAEVNRMISMGFSGAVAGQVFEGEKRFDLVMRLDKGQREDIHHLENLYIDTPSGGKIPLSELASITYTTGPAKISRDDTKRRIVVGVNVRDRDLQSVVDDIQEILNTNLDLPTGYNVSYGGQFENLKSAKDRLLIAVPVALILIFFMLFFAFNSVKDALIVYSAIPLAAVGGVLLLWLRGLPFSISAGVGFIALFGIAVLNGIVLIEHFKSLKSENFSSVENLIKKGTTERLRPVLLTALAAAFGFLPMAVSTSAGAEVQRPLATVVIGGLVTATLLTLVVLPVLYAWLNQKKHLKVNKTVLSVILIVASVYFGRAQNPKQLAVEEVYNLALQHNNGLKAMALNQEESKALEKSASLFADTNVYYSYDENNLAINDRPIDVFGVAQEFKFPTAYVAEKRLLQQHYEVSKQAFNVANVTLKRVIYAAYYTLNYKEHQMKTYKFLDSLFLDFASKAERRFELGESNYLEMITARSKYQQIKTAYKQVQQGVLKQRIELQKIVQVEDLSVTTISQPIEKLTLQQLNLDNNVSLAQMQTAVDYQEAKTVFAKQQLLPQLTAEYFQGTNSGLKDQLIGYQFGIKIPVLFGGKRAKIKAEKLAKEALLNKQKDFSVSLESKQQSLLAELRQYDAALAYYQKEGKALAEEILNTANKSYKGGEIDFFQYIQSIETAKDIHLDYLKQLHQYNQTVIKINYLTL